MDRAPSLSAGLCHLLAAGASLCQPPALMRLISYISAPRAALPRPLPARSIIRCIYIALASPRLLGDPEGREGREGKGWRGARWTRCWTSRPDEKKGIKEKAARACQRRHREFPSSRPVGSVSPFERESGNPREGKLKGSQLFHRLKN